MTEKQKITENQVVRIPADKLELGMYVSRLDRPWLDTSFSLQGFPLDKPEDIKSLRDICEFVYIDTLKSRFLSLESRNCLDHYANHQRIEYRTSAAVEDEVKIAHRAHQQSLSEIHSLLNRSRNSESISASTRAIRSCVKDCVDSIERNPSALLWLTRIKHVDDYTAEHCLNVGLLAIALGRHLGLDRKMLELLGLSGMLHDVGKMQIDPAILNKPSRLTPEEFEQVKLHTVHGKSILKGDALLPSQVIDAAYSHHERIDGKGYPQGVSAREFHLCTRIVSIVDAYDAITSSRCYSKANNSATALKILYENRDTQFDAELVVKFIECIGIYPPGSLVEMKNGEVGVVISADPKNRLLPRVMIVLGEDKQPVHQYAVDLQEQRRIPSGPQHHIKHVLPDGSFGVSIEAFTHQPAWLGDKELLTSDS